MDQDQSAELSRLRRRIASLERNAETAGGGGAALPVGMSIEGYWTVSPSGFLLEDGSAYLKAEYAALAAVLAGVTPAHADPLYFYVPDSRGRVGVNRDPSDPDFDGVGEKRGAKTHTLTQNEMPAHTHTQNAHSHGLTDPGHTHVQDPHAHSMLNGSGFQSGGTWSAVGTAGSGLNTSSTTATNRSATTGVSVNGATATNQNTGGGQAHNNVQPSIVVTRVIKY